MRNHESRKKNFARPWPQGNTSAFLRAYESIQDKRRRRERFQANNIYRVKKRPVTNYWQVLHFFFNVFFHQHATKWADIQHAYDHVYVIRLCGPMPGTHRRDSSAPCSIRAPNAQISELKREQCSGHDHAALEVGSMVMPSINPLCPHTLDTGESICTEQMLTG